MGTARQEAAVKKRKKMTLKRETLLRLQTRPVLGGTDDWPLAAEPMTSFCITGSLTVPLGTV